MSNKTHKPLGSGAMFDQIARRYDLLNRLMSFGLDKRWRTSLVRALELPPKAQVLDLAAGTGDLSLALLRLYPDAQIKALDPAAEMLAIGRQKVAKAKLAAQCELLQGDAHALPFADQSFDACMVAFGVRNFSDRALALRELMRVTKSGGQLAILELGEPRRGPLSWAARIHVHHLVPRLGSLLSGAKEYRYLQESIAAFPAPEDFLRIMQEVGYEDTHVRGLSFDSVHLYLGKRS